MKRWLFLFILLPIHSFAATWFVSNGGSDSNAGTSSGAPFATLAKAQSVYHAGDILNLARGSTFTGTLNWSGIIQAYGVGANPVISGFDDLTSWINIGTNLWRAHDGSLGATVKVLTVNGIQKPMGRFPHSAYATYDGVVANTSITAPSLIGTWSGQPQIVIRKNHFDMQTYPITSVSGTGVVNYTAPSSAPNPTNGYGCFLQNSPEACTDPGDYAYDGAGNIVLYSIGSPTGVKVSRYQDLLTIAGNSTVVNGVDFTGANGNAIYSNNRSSILIENLTVSLCDIGIYLNNNTGAILTGVTTDKTNGNGITFATSTNNTITNSFVNNAAMIPGAATEYSGIRVIPISARNTTITHTEVFNTGYNGFFVEGSFTADYPKAHQCVQILDDGSCWYTGIGHTPVVIPASTLSHGIFYDAIGAPAGTSNGINQGVNIYLDDNSNNITVSNCTAYNAGQYNLFSHNNNNIIWSNCLAYNGLTANLALIHDNLGGKLSNITLSNLQLINLNNFIIVLKSIAPDALPTDLQTWGNASNNHYGNTTTTANPFQTQLFSASIVNRTFAGWQGITNQDISGSNYITIPSPSALYPNPTSSSPPITLSAVYKDLLGNSYSGTVNIAAYSALYLYYFSAIPPAIPNIHYSPRTNVYFINQTIPNLVPSNSGGNVVSWSISPAQPSGLLFGTGNGVLSSTPLALSAPTQYIVSATNASGTSRDTLTLSVVDVPPIINAYTPSSQSAIINVPITDMVATVSGGAPTLFIISPALPASLSLNSVTGRISGTGIILLSPTVFNLTASNTGGNSAPFPVTISISNPAPVAPNIHYPSSTYSFPINTTVSPILPINTGGTPSGYSINNTLPAGLTFSTVTGALGGLPTVAAVSAPFIITATNISGSSPTTVNIAVVNSVPPIAVISYSPSTVVFNLGVTISNLVPSNSGGGGISSWSISPAVSSGLSFSTSTGILSGQPSALSPVIAYTVSATNPSGIAHTTLHLSVINKPSSGTIRVRTNKVPHFINRH